MNHNKKKKDKYETASNLNKNKAITIEKYLGKIRLYLKIIINNLKKSSTWKVQLTIVISFMSSKDVEEKHLIHFKSHTIEFMIGY